MSPAAFLLRPPARRLCSSSPSLRTAPTANSQCLAGRCASVGAHYLWCATPDSLRLSWPSSTPALGRRHRRSPRRCLRQGAGDSYASRRCLRCPPFFDACRPYDVEERLRDGAMVCSVEGRVEDDHISVWTHRNLIPPVKCVRPRSTTGWQEWSPASATRPGYTSEPRIAKMWPTSTTALQA